LAVEVADVRFVGTHFTHGTSDFTRLVYGTSAPAWRVCSRVDQVDRAAVRPLRVAGE
jgi:hypothetical protein